ncbi:MAG TPA: hypothetical protein VEL07_19940 [Planctomycetota bacterium]|nr:hypothetical protein [Planctomycetota bacterium]
MHPRPLRWNPIGAVSALIALLSILSACGGGGGQDTGGARPGDAPLVRATVTQVTLEGSVSGDAPGDVVQVFVAGQRAEMTGSSWRLAAPFSPPSMEYVVTKRVNGADRTTRIITITAP